MAFWSYNGTTSTTGFGWSYVHEPPPPVRGHVDITLRPVVAARDVISFATQAARGLWPDRVEPGVRSLAPLIASVAREVNVRRQACAFRIERVGDRQTLMPKPEPRVAPDPELPAEEVAVVASERGAFVWGEPTNPPPAPEAR